MFRALVVAFVLTGCTKSDSQDYFVAPYTYAACARTCRPLPVQTYVPRTHFYLPGSARQEDMLDTCVCANPSTTTPCAEKLP